MLLVFNEVVQAGEGMVEISDGGGNTFVTDVQNTLLQFQGRKVVFQPKRTAGATVSTTQGVSVWETAGGAVATIAAAPQYYVLTSAHGTFKDASGNSQRQLDTRQEGSVGTHGAMDDTWFFAVEAAPAEAPILLLSQPYHEQVVGTVDFAVLLQFSEKVQAAGGGSITVTDCGDDGDCRTVEDNLDTILLVADYLDFGGADACDVDGIGPGGSLSTEQGSAAAQVLDGASLVTGATIAANCVSTAFLGTSNVFQSFGGVYYTGRNDGAVLFDHQRYSNLENLFKLDRKYLVSVNAGAVANAADNSLINPAFSFIFTTGALRGFSRSLTVLSDHPHKTQNPIGIEIDETLDNAYVLQNQEFTFSGTVQVVQRAPTPKVSTSSALAFSISLNADVLTLNAQDNGDPTRTYEVCFCDEQADTTLVNMRNDQNLRDEETVYKVTDDRRCSGAGGTPSYIVRGDNMMPDWAGGTDSVGHGCVAKCRQGCIEQAGSTCFCDGDLGQFEEALLCLSPEMCREACEAHSPRNPTWRDYNALQASDDTKYHECIGIDIHKERNACFLIGAVAQSRGAAECAGSDSLAVDQDFLHFRAVEGAVCTDASDFKQSVGVLTVTDRVQLGASFILEPGAAGSIEVVTANSKNDLFPVGKSVSSDRITIIDCKGRCGVSSPTTSVATPSNAELITTWNDWNPVNSFVDAPHNDTEQGNLQVVEPVEVIVTHRYEASATSHCPGSNLDLDNTMLTIEGARRPLAIHRCYAKCSVSEPCTDEAWCHCEGFKSAHDGPTSNALCLPAAELRELCDRLPDCLSVDVSRTLPRGFLNSKTCATAEQGFTPDYDYQEKKEPMANRRLQSTEVRDLGLSWNQLLRFPVTFRNGGTFKACFCDSVASSCLSVSDYSILLGEVSVSGVSCLLSDPKNRRTTCVSMYHGGLRCYSPDMDVPQVTLPPLANPNQVVPSTYAGQVA
mmetsp:Transcript_1132/g.2367  ORF Transcript_1132/g.2367 Transcript_1132/m.2367 type:complete len:959 (+) Transcript_1132:1-2877(+)